MKKLVVLLLASLVATSAFAVLDPDSDSIGIYFDVDANTNSGVFTANVPFQVYLIATNPSPANINAYELGFHSEIDGGSYFVLANAPAAPNSIDIGAKDALGNGDYIVGQAAPTPTTEATILHAWTMMQTGVAAPQLFFLYQASLPSIEGVTTPILQDADSQELYIAGQSTGGADIPVAGANDPDFSPVSVEEASFGSVKSLFR